jgi:hypothetical protein
MPMLYSASVPIRSSTQGEDYWQLNLSVIKLQVAIDTHTQGYERSAP